MSLADNTTPAEEDLLRTLLSDPGFPLGLRPLPAGSGEPQSSVKSEEVAAVAPSVDWLGLAGATFGAHSTIPLLSSNPLTYGQSQAVLQQGQSVRFPCQAVPACFCLGAVSGLGVMLLPCLLQQLRPGFHV